MAPWYTSQLSRLHLRCDATPGALLLLSEQLVLELVGETNGRHGLVLVHVVAPLLVAGAATSGVVVVCLLGALGDVWDHVRVGAHDALYTGVANVAGAYTGQLWSA